MRESTKTSNNRGWKKTQLGTEIIDIVLQTFDATVKYSKVLVKLMKLMMKFYLCLHNFCKL